MKDNELAHCAALYTRSPSGGGIVGGYFEIIGPEQ